MIFSISVPCYASDVDSAESDPTGWNSWTLNEKISFVGKYGLDLISCFTGIVYGNPESMDELLRDTFAAKDGYGVSSYYEFLASNLGFDDSTETWELSDDLVSFLNDFITNYNDQVTMVYRYPVQSQNVNLETFPNKTVYDTFEKILLRYPDCYIFTRSSGYQNISLRGKAFLYLDGSVGCAPYNSSWDGFTQICVMPAPSAGVSQYFDLYAAATTFYNSDLVSSFSPCLLYIGLDGRIFNFTNIGRAGWGESYEELDPDNLPAFSDLKTKYDWSWYGSSKTTFSDNKYVTSFSASTCYSASPNALNVYKSEADMKKVIGSQFIGSYTNTYTGSTVNNITQTEINNIVNNYYPPDPDPAPDDPGGGGSSSESKDYTFILNRIISEIQNLNFSDLNDILKEIKVLVSNIYQNMYDFSDMDANITDIKNFMQDVVDQLDELNDNLVALSRALVGKDAFEDALSGVKSNIPDPDDIILASVNELTELQEEALSFGGALGDIFSKLLDFQTGIDDLVQDEEYIDEVEDLLRQLLPKDPEDNEDDSFFDKILKTIEMSLQLYANSVDEIKETSKKKFPFSIGYDIELLLLLLSAEPQTPVFTIPFEYGRINYKSEIVIDFSMFDDSIDVIRFFLTIYYCFFLLMITPKMIGLNNEVDS